MGVKPGDSVLKAIRVIVPILAAICAIALAGYLLIGSLKFFGALNDFPQYHATARLIAAGKAAEVYDTASLLATERMLHPDLQRPVALFVPPPAALLFLPIALLPASAAFAGWMLVLVASFIGALYLIARMNALPLVGIAWLIAATLMFGPTFEALRIAQPATIMLLALSLACGFGASGKNFLAGLCLGVLLLKPQELLPIAIFLVGARQWRVIGGLASVAAVLTAFSIPVFGLSGYQNYLQLLADPTSADLMQSSINPTVRGQLALVFEIDSPVTKYGALAALAIAYLGCLWAGIRWARTPLQSGNPFQTVLTVIVPVALVTAWHCHDYDLVLLIPGLVAAFLQGQREQKALPPLLIILGSLPFMLPIYIPLHYFYLLKGGVVNPYFGLLLADAVVVFAKCCVGKIPLKAVSSNV